MFTDNTITACSIEVYHISYHKKKPQFVPARQFHGLTFRISGVVSVETDNKKIITKPGDITFIPQGTAYTTEITCDGEAYAIHFSTIENYDDLVQEVTTPVNEKLFSNLFSELYSRYKTGRENDFYCMSILYSILHELKKENSKSTENLSVDPRIKRAKSKIEKNFGDINLSVSTLARDAGMSEVYFRKQFTKFYGMPPVSYIKKTRIENSKALLRTGYYNVSETATKCGFDSISYFSYEFHRIVGVTPKKYIDRFS